MCDRRVRRDFFAQIFSFKGDESDNMVIDSAQTGDIIEVKWSAGYNRTIQMILISPIYSDIGTVNQRLTGWTSKAIYDDGSAQSSKVPYNITYELKWLKLCERQGNLKMISEAHVKDEANK